MKVSLILPSYVVGALVLCTACQSTDELSDSKLDQHSVSITATIGQPTSTGRYVLQSENDKAQFTTNDAIGVFMDEKPAVLWTFSGTSWSTQNPMFWPDNNQMHLFEAYAPCLSPAAISKNNVPMPSLLGQNGHWQEISRYDFLVATRSISYTANHGNVAFSGAEHAFKHVSTLLKIRIKAIGDMQGSTLEQLTLSGGTDLFSKSNYSFTTQKVTIEGAAANNSITLIPKQKIQKADVTYYLIVNGQPVTEAGNHTLQLALKYTASDGKTHFSAQKEDIACKLSTGSSYLFNVEVQGDRVIVSGSEISDWNAGNGAGETITINGKEY